MSKKVLILGGGYAGIRTATALKKKSGDFQVTLVDQHDYHTEKTCLHEVATGQKRPEDICYNIPKCVNGSHSQFIQDTVVKIDKDAQVVELKSGTKLEYDYLVMALGFESESFGIAGVDENAFSMVNLEEAKAIHRHILNEFELWQKDKDPKHLEIVICGAGFTGIELAGAFVEEIPKYAKKYGFSPADVKLQIVEASSHLLPMFPRTIADYAIDYLKRKGCKFETGAKINKIEPGVVHYVLDDVEKETTGNTIIWTTGVRGSHLVGESGFAEKRGRVIVKDDLTIEGYDNIFMIGDVAAAMNPENNMPYPTTAQIALAMSDTCADNILAKINGQPCKKFVYVSKGTVCSLGNTNAIGQVGKKCLKGYPASALKKIIATRAIHMGSRSIGTMFSKGRFDLYR